MSLIQETDLKMYLGARGTYQSNLPLQSRGEKTELFSTWCYHRGWGVGVGGWERKREKKPHKDLGKKFQAQALQWKDHKEVLGPFVNNWTNKFITGPSPVWPLVIWSVFITRILLPAQASMTDMPGWHERCVHTRGNKKPFHGLQPSSVLLWGKDDWLAALHTFSAS